MLGIIDRLNIEPSVPRTLDLKATHTRATRPTDRRTGVALGSDQSIPQKMQLAKGEIETENSIAASPETHSCRPISSDFQSPSELHATRPHQLDLSCFVAAQRATCNRRLDEIDIASQEHEALPATGKRCHSLSAQSNPSIVGSGIFVISGQGPELVRPKPKLLLLTELPRHTVPPKVDLQSRCACSFQEQSSFGPFKHGPTRIPHQPRHCTRIVVVICRRSRSLHEIVGLRSACVAANSPCLKRRTHIDLM